MRRKSPIGKIIFIGVIVLIIAFIIAKKFFVGSGTNSFKGYVSKFENAITTYASKELGANVDPTVYEYNDLLNKLIEKNYLDEYEDLSVSISSKPITIEKKDGNLYFYNYNNTTTLENRFELIFAKNDKIYTCTKNECK